MTRAGENLLDGNAIINILEHVHMLMSMTADEGTQLSDLFRLLGEPNRLRLVVACMDQPRSVGDLTRELGASQSLVSQHLRLLRAARLLRQNRQGKNVLYDLPDCHVRSMLTNMIEHVSEPEPEELP